MGRIEHILDSLRDLEMRTDRFRPDGRTELYVILLLTGFLVSVPRFYPDRIFLFAFYPLIQALRTSVPLRNLGRSLLLLSPFFILMALPNLFLSRDVFVSAGLIGISVGQITFVSIILKSFISLSVILVFVRGRGLRSVMKAWDSLPLPGIFRNLVLMLYRNVVLLIRESLLLSDARRLRGSFHRRFTLKEASQVIGQLLIRSVRRADRIHDAMELRRFSSGSLRKYPAFRLSDFIYIVSWAALFAVFRFVPATEAIGRSALGLIQ